MQCSHTRPGQILHVITFATSTPPEERPAPQAPAAAWQPGLQATSSLLSNQQMQRSALAAQATTGEAGCTSTSTVTDTHSLTACW